MGIQPDPNLDGMERKAARDRILELPRNQKYRVYVSQKTTPEFEVWIVTDGRKKGEEGDDTTRRPKDVNKDFTVHYTNEKRNISYIDDFFLDIITKQAVIRERGQSDEFVRDWTRSLLESIRNSVELYPVPQIYDFHPTLHKYKELPGHPIELLLALAKWLGVQEDVNYWGVKYREDKKTRKWRAYGRYDGREKPIKALNDYFVGGMSLQEIYKKHFAYY